MAAHVTQRRIRCGAGLLALAGVGVLLLNCARGQGQPGPFAPVEAVSEEDLKAAHEALVQALIRRGYLMTDRVTKAMRETRRHRFVPEWLWPFAYDDRPLPIGHEQTISAPSIVAMMTELLRPGAEDVVLEVGTGSGYQAAVLAHVCKHVYSIEILEPLAEQAKKTLGELGYENVTVRCGDGYLGWPAHAPFDSIIVTCAPEKVPQPLVDQLKEGGRMVIPVGKRWSQQLYVMVKANGQIERIAIVPVMFVPMTGKAQEEE